MKSKSDHLTEQLRALDPLSAEKLDQALSASSAGNLLEAILASEPQRPEGRRGARRTRAKSTLPRKRLLAPAAVCAVGALALVIGLPGGGGGSHGSIAALDKVAEAAAAQPAPNTDLPYLYMKRREMATDTSVAGGQAWSVYDSSIHEEWVAKDGSGRVRRVANAPRWVSPADREAWEAAGSMKFTDWSAHTVEEDVPAGHFGQLFGGTKFSELPTDSTELAAWLEDRVTNPKANAGAGNGFSVAVRSLALASEILNDPLASPELRAALYEAEGLVPGIEYFGKATDAIGRHGLAIGAESANSGAPTRYSLIFDPETSQVLATEETRLKPPSGRSFEPAPLLTEAQLFLASGTTSSLNRKP